MSDSRAVSSEREAKFGTTIAALRADSNALAARSRPFVTTVSAASEAAAKTVIAAHAQALRLARQDGDAHIAELVSLLKDVCAPTVHARDQLITSARRFNGGATVRLRTSIVLKVGSLFFPRVKFYECFSPLLCVS